MDQSTLTKLQALQDLLQEDEQRRLWRATVESYVRKMRNERAIPTYSGLQATPAGRLAATGLDIPTLHELGVLVRTGSNPRMPW